MATVCLQCGDSGFDVALIYCEDCQNYAIHRYCLETLPKTFDEYVDWFCDDCQSKLGKPDTNEESCSPLCEVEDLPDLKIAESVNEESCSPLCEVEDLPDLKIAESVNEESCSPLCEVDDLPDLKIAESVQCTKNPKEHIPLERLGKNKKRKRKKREKNDLKPQKEIDEEGGQLGDKGTEKLGKKKEKKNKKRKKNKLKPQREKDDEGGQLGEKGMVFTSGAEVEKTKGYGFVTFRDRKSARRACENSSPVIDGRRAYCNLASLSWPRPPLPCGHLRPVTPLIGSVRAPRGSNIGSPVYHHRSSYGYQPGYVYPIYGYPTYGPNYVYPQGAYNPYMAQHYPQRNRAPSTNSSDVCSSGQSGHQPPGNHGYPMLRGYQMPGQQITRLGGPNITGGTTAAVPHHSSALPYRGIEIQQTRGHLRPESRHALK